MTEIRRIGTDDIPALTEFIHALPEGDRTFFKEEVSDDTVKRWCNDRTGSRRWVLEDDGVIEGILAIIPGSGWSAHVGELRLVVGAPFRRQGVGRALARHGLTEGLRTGLGKIVVEVVAEREGDIAMFTKMGFRPEALLERHIRAGDGSLRDLVVLAHHADDAAGVLGAFGVDEAVA
jgi:ribosomal protein S18 acetylase RimI-like enzyme